MLYNKDELRELNAVIKKGSKNNDLLAARLHKTDTSKDGVVIFYLAPLNCTDMGGAIELATMLKPTVHTIITVAGVFMDTYYVKTPDGWFAQSQFCNQLIEAEFLI